MTDKAKSAELILRLYELRREEVMRNARNWFFGFNPDSVEEIQAAVQGEHSAYYRMVTSYWDMAASFVNHGAVDEEMFNDANAEQVFVFAKIQPFLAQIRAATSPGYMAQLEKLVMRMPDAEKRLEHARQMARGIAAARARAEAEQASADAANA